MSHIKEKPGHLVFPVNKYRELQLPNSAITVVLLHHPLNWYAQGTYHPLKQFLKSTTDFIISGHEHLQGASETEDVFSTHTIFIEGGAINPHEASGISSFNTIYFDIPEKKYRCELYEWTGIKYEPKDIDTSWINYSNSRRHSNDPKYGAFSKSVS